MKARETKERKRARLARITVAAVAAVFGVAVLLLSGLVIPASSSDGWALPDRGAPVHVEVTPATQIYLNRTQSSGTYINEYVSLNNSTSLTKLPAAVITVKSATDCRWVTVENMSTRVDDFHSVVYQTLSTANGSGTVANSYAPPTNGYGSGTFASSFSWKACGGTQYWVNYQYWTFTFYHFAAPSLGYNGTVTMVYLQLSTAAKHYYNATYTLGSTVPVTRKVPTNYSVQFTVPGTVTGKTTTDSLGVKTTPVWTFKEASIGSPATNTTTTTTLTFGAAGAVYQNWTVAYTESNTTGGNAVSGVLESGWGAFLANATEILLIALILGVLGAAIYVARRR